MGLLRSQKLREIISNIMFSYPNAFCAVLYVVGLLWLVSLNHPDMNRGTYFSENALLPGLVDPQLQAGREADRYFDSYSHAMSEIKDKDDTGMSWIGREMEALGLEVYYQNYNFTYPMEMLQQQIVKGENLYAVLRSPRGASTEAFVITTPLRLQSAGLTQYPGSVAAMLGLAKAMMRYTYWSRDIVFLFTENEYVGMQAWLDGYIGERTSQYINAQSLPGHIGVISAALNLEVEGKRFQHLRIKIEGFNGQLPNLDYINLISRLCQSNQIRLLHHRSPEELDPRTMKEYLKYSFLTSARMVMQQATGMVSGNHGLFLRYRIEAASLESVGSTNRHGFESLTTVVEGITRSINNLLERFHQSFFFYILPSLDRYVSIGMFIPPFAIMVSACLLQALAVWFKFYKEIWFRNKNINERRDVAFTTEGSFSREMIILLNIPDTMSSAVAGLSAPLLLSLFCGYLVYKAPDAFSSPDLKQNFPPDVMVIGMLGLWISGVLLVAFAFSKKEELRMLSWEPLKSIALVAHGLLLFAMSLINFSFSVLLAIFTVPVYCAVRPVQSRILTLLQAILLLVCSPVGLLFLLVFLHALIDPTASSATPSVTSDPYKLVGQVQMSVVYALLDSMLFNNYLFPLICFFVNPIWQLVWTCIWIRI